MIVTTTGCEDSDNSTGDFRRIPICSNLASSKHNRWLIKHGWNLPAHLRNQRPLDFHFSQVSPVVKNRTEWIWGIGSYSAYAVMVMVSWTWNWNDEWSDILAPGSFFAGPNNLRGTNLVGSNRTQILFSPATRQLRAIDKIRENESNLSTSDGLSFIVLPNIGQVKQPTGLHLRSQPFSISTAVERMKSPLWTWKS